MYHSAEPVSSCLTQYLVSLVLSESWVLGHTVPSSISK